MTMVSLLFRVVLRVMMTSYENDAMMTSDCGLHAMVEPRAIYSSTTGQWSLVVSCGHSTFPPNPPFEMEWTTPASGVPLHNSDGYKDGHFQLHVTSGGEYTCSLPQHAAADLCHRNATVHVDRLEARVTLMEARLQQLEKENKQLVERIEQLTERFGQRVAFTARLSEHHQQHSVIIFGDVLSNYGDGYSPSSGVFTAPVSGLYLFVLTATAHSQRDYPSAVLWRGLGGELKTKICSIQSASRGHVASCAVAISMTQGRRVWAFSRSSLHKAHTSLTGVLITAN